MTALCDYLRARLEAGGFSTEDALAAFLPLAEEVAETHAAGRVAPLEGLGALEVEGSRIFFSQSRRLPPRAAPGQLRCLEAAIAPAAVEVVSEFRLEPGDGEDQEQVEDLAIGTPGEPLRRPVYLPGYVAWEHQCGHHDPLTDIFSLGMILASLACGLDFADPTALRRFVASRRNPFALRAELHPVVARAIVRMTELQRHRRAQDLRGLVRALENYRDQEIDLEFELARLPAFQQRDRRDKQAVVLSKLRERLLEISRRNRLLHFRPTLQSINLTQASVPLSFDIQNIRPEQLLLWNEDFQSRLCSGKPLALGKYLNFAEAAYLPGALDHILAEAHRDEAEFGFAQLRLVACFLHWSNVKTQPVESFESPLILLPVALKKKKGVRDSYSLELLSTEAEVNPVLRHLFGQLYGIELPETIDLAERRLEEFFEYLRQQIQRSEPGVMLHVLDRPRIALIHDKARRRLEQYRRRARLAGRGVRSFLDLDYSYDPANYHPLGLRLFEEKIRPPQTRLERVLGQPPQRRAYAVPGEETDRPPPAAEVQRSFYRLEDASEENPYAWNIDLGAVTLGNFKYRKMSLVRDYEAILEQRLESPPFEATFSLTPRPVTPLPPAVTPLDDRYPVVPCDPTQTAAIELARQGRSYIIQGPPGTGKSQTIANLIADYVARRQRVLFVCEKRAAIDVVYARLRQRGLGDLCSLIHDSQTDKRPFVAELRQTYEAVLGEWQEGGKSARRTRTGFLRELKQELRPLEQFDAQMRQRPAVAGTDVRELISRAITLQGFCPELSAEQQESLPPYAAWEENREVLETLSDFVSSIRPDRVFARHPLAALAPSLADCERPDRRVEQLLSQAEEPLTETLRLLGHSGVAEARWQTPRKAAALLEYAQRVLPVAEAGQFKLLDPGSPHAERFALAVRPLESHRAALAEAEEATRHWRRKLSAADTALALDQARAFARQKCPWLRAGWWRLRGVLRAAYDFKAHLVRPDWVAVLSALGTEYERRAELDRIRARVGKDFALTGEPDAMAALVVDMQHYTADLPPWLARYHGELLRTRDPGAALAAMTPAGEWLARLGTALASLLADFDDTPWEQLRDELAKIRAALADLPGVLACLRELGRLPESLSAALRRLPLPPEQIEAVLARRTLAEIYRAEPGLAAFNGMLRDRQAGRLQRAYARWLESNALEVRRRTHERFLENVQVSSLSAAQLSEAQKEFKRVYSRGRRELEHEFGKSMRYKSIRDLATGDSGAVIQDLKPIWLMSPLSVSDTLPLVGTEFDVVIFDEASQIPLEEAVPSLFRARQAIIVGDQMQLPPTDFFSARRSEEEDEFVVEEEGDSVKYDLESNSFLSHAAKNLPSAMLGWHYRSRSESLVSFSNWAFYGGRLLTVPEEELPTGGRRAIIVRGAADAVAQAAELLARPISFHRLEAGVYEKRRNRAEAEYIAALVRELLARGGGKSLGVVAFSEAQQGEIDEALERLARRDPEFADRLEAERQREVDGQFVGLLVKNLENIQGDERDIVILSVCYGPNPQGRVLMNFGPINQSGGEKRLNVAFSRAKHHMAVVSSIGYGDITNDYNDGAACLKNYLRYAEAVSSGDDAGAKRILRLMSRWQDDGPGDEMHASDPVADQLAEALMARGYEVDRAVGHSRFRCDLAVRRAGDPAYRLGILLDGPSYYEQTDLLERDMMRPQLLRDFGWQVAVVLAKDWHQAPAEVLAQLEKILGGNARNDH